MSSVRALVLVAAVCLVCILAQDTLLERFPHARSQYFTELSKIMHAQKTRIDMKNLPRALYLDRSQDVVSLAKVQAREEQAASSVSIPEINRLYRHLLFEGDMRLTDEQLRILSESMRDVEPEHVTVDEPQPPVGGDATAANSTRTKRQAFRDSTYPASIWQDGVPYEFHPAISAVARSSISLAIRFWEQQSCVRFRARTPADTHYLKFISHDEGCYSDVGKGTDSGPQIVAIGAGCEHMGVTTHEIAHALGLFHEQSRYDRDRHVTLQTANVQPNMLYNFAKVGPRFLAVYNQPYDIGSVMHYTPVEFSKDGVSVTLRAVDPELQSSMGSMDMPSFVDIALINTHYKCPMRCANQLNCLNGGYTDSNNCSRCKCPTGYGGPTCGELPRANPIFCQGMLTADDSTKTLDIDLPLNPSETKPKNCAYRIQAPPGRVVEVVIKNVDGTCQSGCYTDSLELKMTNDARPVGYRYCCSSASGRRLVSSGSEVVVLAFARANGMNAKLEYRTVPASLPGIFASQNVRINSLINKNTKKGRGGGRKWKKTRQASSESRDDSNSSDDHSY